MLFQIRRHLLDKLVETQKSNGHSTEYEKARTDTLVEILSEITFLMQGLGAIPLPKNLN